MPSAVVVGAGVFGSALARQLAGAGWQVTLVEQERPGWDGAASGGESRLIRWSHGPERSYMRSARRARELWREMDASLVVECGLAWFAHRDEGWESDSQTAMREEGISFERLEVADAARLFPSLGGGDLRWVLYEPEAGVLRAGAAVARLVEQAREGGAQLVRGTARPDGARVQLERTTLEADHVVWACGPWLGRLFPEHVELRVTRQVVPFLGAGPEWSGTPGWVDYDRSFYGHGDIDGWGFKVASDAEGPETGPDAPVDEADVEAAVRRAADYVAERFPSLRDAPVLSRRICPYELTADTHFVAAPLPEHPNVWLLGGGSGHGFKHAPALAERMAIWMRGDEPPEPRFGLGPRRTERSLRTASGPAAAS